MNEPRKRRRFQFTLRTFFVVLTLFAIWLGWNAYQVRQRHRMERYVASIAGSNPPMIYGQPLKPWKSLPIMWQLMGVKPIQVIYLGGAVPDEDRPRIRDWFPEADVLF